MVRSGFAVGCVALLCLGTGCPKDVEDPGFTSGATTTAPGTSTGEPEDDDPPVDEDDSETAVETSSTSTTGEPPGTSTTTSPATTTGPATDTGDPTESTAGADCGNAMVETGEQCDGADLQGFDCGSLGLGTGAVSCTAMCTFDTSMCMNMGGTSG